MKSKKRYHVYDSFEGLPEKHEHDGKSDTYGKGDCRSSEDEFVEHFISRRIAIPERHKGWFAQIPDEEYPDQICFAFLDSDFYTSITDSWNKIYHKLSPGAVVCVHDYGWEKLPGVYIACDKFLIDKPEHGTIRSINNVGIMVKL
jgi:O-methyltransferase